MKLKWLGSLLILALAVSGCASGNGNTNSSSEATPSQTEQASASAASASPEAQADPYGAFAEPVTLSIAKETIPNNNLPEGGTLENNEFTKYIEKKLNVKVTHAWESEPGDPYTQKVGLTIASNAYPDAMMVNLEQLTQLVKADAIADLTDAYNANASPLVKEIYESFQDQLLGMVTFDGKIMALPSSNIGYQHDLMWVRKDWLDKLGLPAPKTMDDIVSIAKAFIEQDPDGNSKADTFGLLGDSRLAGPTIRNTVHSFNNIFGMFGAFPGTWIKDASGNVANGSIAPETKTALAKLSELYKAGIIDKQFAVRKPDDTNALVASSKAGIVFGPWWIPYWPLNDSVKNEPKAEWIAYNAPLDADGKLNVVADAPTTRFLVVRKDYKHPDAVVKVLNVQSAAIRSADPIYSETQNIYKDLGVNWANWPFALQLDYNDAVIRGYDQVKAALDANSMEGLSPEILGRVKMIQKELANPKKDLAAWAETNAWTTGVIPMKDGTTNIVSPAFYGTTPTMKTKGSVLGKLESQAFLKIVIGEASIDSFDDFVKQWKSLGGDQITKEVAEASKQ
ncbi:extracellular solute-binding protein [Cohnella sp. WQ 127256]|uniref:extracellular solute-binding protein n=1 Tax=Cohnella sp. WQ 127256 TaxID=2938790 RepID=UPI0021175379|nr:extracellular solute-binding protein [Cohnella sp. WQ 127256]